MSATDAVAPQGRGAWLAVGLAWLCSLTAIVVWLSAASTGALREQLKVLQPWWLDSTVLIGALIGVCAISGRRRVSAQGHRIAVLSLMALALCLTVFVAPRTNRIFYDEQIYQSIGQNISDLRLAQVCNDGTVDSGRLRCVDGQYNKQPYAYPHLLSVAYRIVGVHEWVAFAVNAVAMALSTACVYLLALLLFRDRTAAVFAGLLFALVPQQIVWSATAAVEPTASLAGIVAVLAAAWYLADGGVVPLGALAVAAAYAIQFRPESLLVLPIAAAVAWPRLHSDFERPRGWWAAVLFLALAAVHVAHLFAVRNIPWGTEGARFSWTYVTNNLRTNARFFLGDERFPVLFTVLALVGVASGSGGRMRYVMATWFLLFFAIDLGFYAGSYNYGADVRYSLMTYPAIAMLGGAGAAAVSRVIARRGFAASGVPLVATVVLFQFLWYAPAVRTAGDSAWAARADVRFAKAFATKLPMDSYVLTQNPGMFHVWGVSAGQMSRAVASPNYTSWLVGHHAGGVYVHWNFWCNVQEAAEPALCRRAMALGQTTLVGDYRERDQRFAFYRLSLTPVIP